MRGASLLAAIVLLLAIGGHAFGPSPPPQAAGTLAWKVSLPSWIDGTPTLSPDESMVYVDSSDTLYAVDTHSQTVVWSFTSTSLDAAVLSADGQTVYTYSTWECAGSDCVGVIALETTTGKELWRTKAINKLVYTGYLTPGIIIKDDVLYYSVTKNVTTVSVVACSTTDGSLLWQWLSPYHKNGAYGQQWICLMTAISSSNLLYAGHTGNKMSSINASSGQTVDTIVFDTGTFNVTNLEFYKCNIPTLSHDEQTLYLSLYYLEKHRTNLYGVSANFNTTIVRESYYPYDGISTSVVVSKDDSRVFFGGVSGNIYCVQAGGVQWPPPSPKESNSTIWIFQTWGEVYSVGILDKEEDLFYVGSNDGHFYAINAETGSLSWSFKTGGEIHSGPTLSADGKLVYFGSRDNHLYAISTGK